VELLSLSPCRKLTCLEVLTSSRLYVPFTLKTVSLATLAWPNLAALRLSLSGACAWVALLKLACQLFSADRFVAVSTLLNATTLESSA
jgi:hypothetical protein